ncbi:hypothetical protein ACFRSX_35580 [Streptomyces goshikiensis]|nr:hypothetical protein [Streptomyces sp. CB02120-2]
MRFLLQAAFGLTLLLSALLAVEAIEAQAQPAHTVVTASEIGWP